MWKCNLLYKDSLITHISLTRSLVSVPSPPLFQSKSSPCLAKFQLFVCKKKKKEGERALTKTEMGKGKHNLRIHSLNKQCWVLGEGAKGAHSAGGMNWDFLQSQPASRTLSFWSTSCGLAVGHEINFKGHSQHFLEMKEKGEARVHPPR